MDTKNRNKDLTIIVVHFKTLDLTVSCIDSVYNNPPTCNFDILVVDNGSEDQIEEVLNERFPDVRFITAGKNMGFAGANNLGMQNAKGDFFLLLNSDASLNSDVITTMLDYMSFHPEVGALGPRQVDADNLFTPSCGSFPTWTSEIIRKILNYPLSLKHYELRNFIDKFHSDLSRVDWVSGSCMLLRTKALQDSGLFDERFFMYFEDIDLCRRITMKGWEVKYLPSETVTHLGGQSAKIDLLKVLVENRRSQIYFARKYYGVFGSVATKIFLFLKYGIHGMKWFVLFAAFFVFGRRTGKPFTMLLLAKKICFLIFEKFPHEPAVPAFRIRQAGRGGGSSPAVRYDSSEQNQNL